MSDFLMYSLMAGMFAIECRVLIGVSYGLSKMIRRNSFCIFCILFLCVLAAAAHT